MRKLVGACIVFSLLSLGYFQVVAEEDTATILTHVYGLHGVREKKVEVSIEEAMNNALASGGVDTTKVAFTVDRTSGRSVFATVSGATSPITSFRVLFGVNDKGEEDINTALQFRLGWQLGFRSGTYEASDPSGGAITSEGICFVRGPRYMYLAIDDFNNSGNNYFESAFSDLIRG